MKQKLKLKRAYRKSLRFIKSRAKRTYKQSFSLSKYILFRNPYSRAIRRYANMECGKALKIFAKRVSLEVSIRPRAKFVAKATLALVLLLAISTEAVNYLKPKEQEFKISGQAIFAQANSINYDVAEQTAHIQSKRSPFDFKYPVGGQISQSYSSYHRAVDIATDFGSPIKSLGAGKVVFVGKTSDGKGNVVIVDHGDGLKSLYAHMDKMYVAVGNDVSPEVALGTVGLTGRTTGPHVHLEIYDTDVLVNPVKVLP